jgi:uncharacterized protein YegL
LSALTSRLLILNNFLMYEKPFEAEEVQNYSQKCCVALVLDTSLSMTGSSIDQLNAGIRSFLKEIEADNANLGQKLELGIVTFDSKVRRVSEPKLVEFIQFRSLEVDGTTMMVDGVREGIKMVEQRKEWYKSTGQKYFRPWVIMITDGDPDSHQQGELPKLAAEIRTGMDNEDFWFMAIGVAGAKLSTLELICHEKMKPRMLAGLKFSEFFRWLSSTIADVAKGQNINDAMKKHSDDGWDGGFKI